LSIPSNSIILFSNGETTILEISSASNHIDGTTISKAGTIIVGLYCLGKII
jgi:hypothetical protein